MHSKRPELTRFRVGFLVLAFAFTANAQTPTILSGGVVNGSSYAAPIVPGSLMTIFGANLASSSQASSASPLPTTLAGTSVKVNGIAAPLLFVSPGQINAQVPVDVYPHLAFDMVTVPVVVTTSQGSSTSATANLFVESPGVFTQDGSGCGKAVALNVAPDGSLSLNTPSNSAAPGDYIALLGTGFGMFSTTPSGTAPTDASPFLSSNVTVNLDGKTLDSPNVNYVGVAPGYVGIQQLNVQLPSTTRETCSLPLTVRGQYLESPTVTVSVHSGHGACVDPPITSYGTLSLLRTQTKSIRTGVTTESDSFTATFPSGPGTFPAPNPPPPTSDTTFWTLGQVYLPPAHACPVASYKSLDAGAITITGPNGSITAQPISDNIGGVTYSAVLPLGFVASGAYQVSSQGSSMLAPFSNSFSVPQPLENVNMDGNYATMNNAAYVPATWAGGGPESTVKISAVLNQISYFGFGPASPGILYLGPTCSSVPNMVTGAPEPACLFGGYNNPNEHYVVDQFPTSNTKPGFKTAGITGTIQPTWTFRYEFYSN